MPKFILGHFFLLGTMEIKFRAFNAASDLEFFKALYANAEVMNFIPPRHHHLLEDRILAKFESTQEQVMFVVVLGLEEAVIGEAAIYTVASQGANIYELGYILGKAFWGQGLGSSVCYKLLEYVFEILKGDKVICQMYDTHQSSIKVAERNLMHLEKIEEVGSSLRRLTYAMERDDFNKIRKR